MLETFALTLGRQVATHAVRAWLGHRKFASQRNSQLTDLLAAGIPDQFRRRKLERQLEEIGDQVAHRISPLMREFPDLPPNERQAALDAVVDEMGEADLSDEMMFATDLDPAKIARAVGTRIPPSSAGLNESATALYNLVLHEMCICLVNVVKQLPAFEPRALTEILARFSNVVEKIETILERLPRTTINSPTSIDEDAAFTHRYLRFVSETMDQLDLFGVDVRRYKPRISVTVAYLSLSVSSSMPFRQETGPWGGEYRTDSLRVEQALAQSSRTLLRGQAGSGKTTLLQWVAVNAARGSFTGHLSHLNDAIPFMVKLRQYANKQLPQPQEIVADNAPPIASTIPSGWVDRQFTTGKALVLVDGVDELPADRTAHVRRWLRDLLVAFPHLQVVVTSRPGAADAHWLEGYRCSCSNQ